MSGADRASWGILMRQTRDLQGTADVPPAYLVTALLLQGKESRKSMLFLAQGAITTARGGGLKRKPVTGVPPPRTPLMSPDTKHMHVGRGLTVPP